MKNSLLVRLFRETFPAYKWRYALAFLFMAITAAATGLFGWIIKDIINGVFGEKSMRLALILGGGIMLIFAVKGLSAYAFSVILSKIGNEITAKTQNTMFKALMSQGLDYHVRFNTADSLTRITQNARSVRDIMQLVVVSLGRDILTVIALLCVLIIRDPILFFISFITMPLAVYGVNLIRKRIKKIGALEFQSQSYLTTLLQESLQGIRVVKSFNLSDDRQQKIAVAIDDVSTRNTKIQQLSARTQPMMEMIGGFSIGAVIIYGAWRVIENGSDPGSFFSFLFSLLLAYEPAKRLARLNVQVEYHMAGVRLMYELVDAKPKLVEAASASPLAITQGAVELKNVSFAYGDETVLHDLTLTAEGGKVTALIGGSGAGKSTVLSLIHRFFDVNSGQILIDSQDVKLVSLKSLSNQIAYVSQDNFLFQGTIKENIGFGRLGATLEEIIQAAQNAYAHEFIVSHPLGYDTPLGEFGAGLSGGQKQRIAIARAFLKNAPILLLDEATSALDSASEAEIQKALARLTHNRTTIIVAHRLSTIAHADKIIVLENGQIVEEGSAQQLVEKGGAYAQILAIQPVS